MLRIDDMRMLVHDNVHLRKNSGRKKVNAIGDVRHKWLDFMLAKWEMDPCNVRHAHAKPILANWMRDDENQSNKRNM